MDNGFIVDSAIVLLLLFGAIRGANRGLVRSLLGIFVVAGALLGSLTMVDMLTEPITEKVSARIEGDVVRRVKSELTRIENGSSEKGVEMLTELFEEYDLPSDLIDDLLFNASDIVDGAKLFTSKLVLERLEDAVSVGVRAVVRNSVKTALTVGSFLVLLFVLGLVGKAVDKVFELPLLHETNAVGGAILGLLGAAAAIYALLYLATRFNITKILDYTNGSRLVPFFTPRSTVGLAQTLYG